MVAGILVVGVGLDQWTKWYASRRLASGGVGTGGEVTLRVPPSAEGETLRSFLGGEFAANSERRIDRIASRRVYGRDGRRLGPDDPVREGQFVTVVHREVAVIPGYVELEYAENRGAAFGLFGDAASPYRFAGLVGFSLLALLGLLYLVRAVPPERRVLIAALSSVAAGAVGNLVDRIRLGYVVDFLVVRYGDLFRWPTFNVADVCITVGLGVAVAAAVSGEEA